jgi:hypothetical protein
MKEVSHTRDLLAFARKLGRVANGLYDNGLLKEEQQDALIIGMRILADVANQNNIGGALQLRRQREG